MRGVVAATSTHSRFVLVGATGAGKSSTGNILLGTPYNLGPFQVGGQLASITRELTQHPLGQLDPTSCAHYVVDTPGLADQSNHPDGTEETSKERKARLDQNSDSAFKAITGYLHDFGGTVLFVVKGGRLDTAERLVRHAKALHLVMRHTFAVAAALVLTDIPNELATFAKHSDEVRCKRQKKYQDWLLRTREAVERKLNSDGAIRFRAVLGVSATPGLTADHPAHPNNFAAAAVQLAEHAFVPPRVVKRWHEVLEDGVGDLQHETESLVHAIASLKKFAEGFNRPAYAMHLLTRRMGVPLGGSAGHAANQHLHRLAQDGAISKFELKWCTDPDEDSFSATKEMLRRLIAQLRARTVQHEASIWVEAKRLVHE